MERKPGHRAQGTGVSKPTRPRPRPATTSEIVTAPEIRASKGTRRLVMVTAVDEPSARLADLAGVDIVLVGDSLGMAALGRPDTLSVTLDEMIHHTHAAAAGARRGRRSSTFCIPQRVKNKLNRRLPNIEPQNIEVVAVIPS